MFNNYKDVLTLEETCTAMRLGKNKVYELVHSGQLQSVRVGRRILIPKISLENFFLSALN